jgi:hypothetical protein
MAKLRSCPDCGHWDNIRAKACPKCGRPHRSPALRSLAQVLALVCSLTALGSLLVCLFARPEAWFMVIIWAGLAGVMAAYASRGA